MTVANPTADFLAAFNTASAKAIEVEFDESLGDYVASGFGTFEAARKFRSRKLGHKLPRADRERIAGIARAYCLRLWTKERRLPSRSELRREIKAKFGGGLLAWAWIAVYVVKLLLLIAPLLGAEPPCD